MKDTRYAYAVANVRANENKLLSQSVFEQLISADDSDEVLRILADKGILSAENAVNGDAAAVIGGTMQKVWNYLREISPDKTALDFLAVPNDFHNLKTSLKSIVSRTGTETFFMSPCLVPSAEVYSAAASKKYGELPGWLEDAAKDGYDILTSTADGQLLDVMLDRCSLETMCEMAEGDEFTEALTCEMAVLYDFKIALRAAATGAAEAICSTALCDSEKIDAAALKRAAMRGTEQVKNVIQDSGYSDLADENTAFGFEKKCDNRILRMLNDTSSVSFGIEPLIAYYFRKSAEVQNLRLIINAKHAGLSQKIIRERMREIYV